jgi:hypothetical protein
MRKLALFYQCCARIISNRHIKPDNDGIWTYPPSDSVLEDAGLFPIETYYFYIQMRRDISFSAECSQICSLGGWVIFLSDHVE